jgi:AraC family transcriptional activator FtrA
LAGLPTIIENMPKSLRPRNALVAALVYDGLCTFEFGITTEIFGLPRPEMGADWYRFTTCAVEPGPLRACGGLSVIADGTLDALQHAGMIVIPGWRGVDAAVPDALVAALIEAHQAGARLVSICSGVFVLAATGLLDGKRATTHWRYADALRAARPAVIVDPDVLYVDEGSVLTSAGSAAGLDLLLHIVRCDFGAAAANKVARRLVMSPHREGGQAQFIERPVPARPGGRLAPLLDAMRERLERPMTIAELARQAAMSERTFLRRFREMTGMTPGAWLAAARIETAKALLEAGVASLEDVALRSGFGSAANLRHHFRRTVGVGPAAYRRRLLVDVIGENDARQDAA